MIPKAVKDLSLVWAEHTGNIWAITIGMDDAQLVHRITPYRAYALELSLINTKKADEE